MDHDENLKLLKELVGKDCERTLACNSLKIHFGCDFYERGTSYIWIDPPWVFVKTDEIITSSLDYPDEEKQFKTWGSLLNPLNKTQLLSYDYLDEGILKLHFSENYSLLVPYFPEKEDYEHWYVNKKLSEK